MVILVTGSAGFIGNAVSLRLLTEGHHVVGIDNLNPYYDVNLKHNRIKRLEPYANFISAPIDINNHVKLNEVFKKHKFDKIIHLAAQAGVRHSIHSPRDYIESNISGFLNILEACKDYNIKHLVYASTSSVYGGNTQLPFAEHHSTNHPQSLYAATKKANELMAHSYSHIHKFPVTGLRFFTVYGPWGRPDMALFKFTKAILNNEPIDLYNYGNMKRDFTYIDDIVEGIIRTLAKPPKIENKWDSNQPNPETSGIAAYRVFNIGNNNPVHLQTFVELLEKSLGRKALRNNMPLQAGDVEASWASSDNLIKEINYSPSTSLEDGIQNFVDWYTTYFKIKI